MKKRSLKITEKEKDLLKLMANGYYDVEIKEILKISTSTVRNRLQSMYVKTNTFTRSHLTCWACKNGVI